MIPQRLHRDGRLSTRARSRSRRSLAPLRRKRDNGRRYDGSTHVREPNRDGKRPQPVEDDGSHQTDRNGKSSLYDENKQLHQTNRALYVKLNTLQNELVKQEVGFKTVICELEVCLADASKEARHYKDACASLEDKYRNQEAKLQEQISAKTMEMRNMGKNVIHMVLAMCFY